MQRNAKKKLLQLQNHKKKVMEQYAGEEISFDEYKDLLKILNDKQETLQIELKIARQDLPEVAETPDLSKEDIIANLQENWEYLNNNERMIFLQRFVKKLPITVEKENPRSSIVKKLLVRNFMA